MKLRFFKGGRNSRKSLNLRRLRETGSWITETQERTENKTELYVKCTLEEVGDWKDWRVLAILSLN